MVFKIRREAVCGILGAVAFLCPMSVSLADDVTPAAPAGAQLTPPYYVFNSNIPSDVVTISLGASALQPFVDNLAWNTFIAVNWPVPKTIAQRGAPDRQNVVGGLKYGAERKTVVMPTGPVVWETFKNTDDIFLNPPVKPTAFDAPPIIPAACIALARKDPAATQHVLSSSGQINSVLASTEQAFTEHPLIDQQGKKVWYEVKVNRAYYDYVVNNGFYNSKNQAGKTIDFPISSNTNLQQPVVKVKAAWKVMSPDDPKEQFYTASALLYDKAADTCSEQTVGLVGLHVVQKTEQFQQWAWATFEQVNNAPDETGPVAGTHYNFYNPACSATQCPPNTYPGGSGPNGPTQVVREVPITSSAAAANATFQAALKTLRADNVWQYYMLVDSQWGPLNPPQLGTPVQPRFLANATMETYLQAPTDDPKAPHGCINCHGHAAAKKDLDFQLFKAYPHNGQTEQLLKAFMH